MEQKTNSCSQSSTFIASDEQQQIFDFINNQCSSSSSSSLSNKSCIIQAFAGTGKTTVLLELARQRFEQGRGCTLILTYSKDLKECTRNLGKKQEGVFIHNMHSLVRNILWPHHDCVTNDDIQRYLDLPSKPQPHTMFLDQVTLLCIDEMQDMNELYYLLFQQLRSFFVGKQKPPPDFVGVGDFFQWILKMTNNTSTKYICEAETFFPGDTFRMFHLTRSFRLTPSMCTWINTSLNPLTLQSHYPECWSKYGERVMLYWKTGLQSAKLCDDDDPAVQYVEHDNFNEGLVPKSIANDLRLGRTTLLLNGYRTDRYSHHFSHVKTPYSFKGCEAEHVAVLGCDRFMEEVCCTNSKQSSHEDWPLICYCQMYVSCTRASRKLVVIHSKSKLPFFTMRKTVVEHPLVSVTQQGSRPIHGLLEFVPPDKFLDNCISDCLETRLVIPNTENFRCPPRGVPGRILNTVITPFDHHYRIAVRFAAHVYLTQVEIYRTHIVKNWTGFMRKHILRDLSSVISSDWHADEKWCEEAMMRIVNLINQNYKQPNLKEKCVFGVEFMRLKGTVDYVLNRNTLLQISFHDPHDLKAQQKIWQQTMALYICYKRTHTFECLPNCSILNVVDGTIRRLVLAENEDVFLSELAKRKQWDFLLDSSMTLQQLLKNGVAVPLGRLIAESKKRVQEEVEKRNKQQKKEE